MLNVVWSKKAYADYIYWKKNQIEVLRRINRLIENIQEMPFTGLGKPEPLKHQFQGCWSRRIDREHRIIYKLALEQKQLQIVSCRDHY